MTVASGTICASTILSAAESCPKSQAVKIQAALLWKVGMLSSGSLAVSSAPNSRALTWGAGRYPDTGTGIVQLGPGNATSSCLFRLCEILYSGSANNL